LNVVVKGKVCSPFEKDPCPVNIDLEEVSSLNDTKMVGYAREGDLLRIPMLLLAD
jgi:hypothetical protein